jgi:hypothetical protein
LTDSYLISCYFVVCCLEEMMSCDVDFVAFFQNLLQRDLPDWKPAWYCCASLLCVG